MDKLLLLILSIRVSGFPFEDKSAKMLRKEMTEKILAACFEVSNVLGSGFLESVYEKSLLVALRHKNISAQAQVPLTVSFRGEVVGNFVADIVVEKKVLLELKAVRELLPYIRHSSSTI